MEVDKQKNTRKNLYRRFTQFRFLRKLFFLLHETQSPTGAMAAGLVSFCAGSFDLELIREFFFIFDLIIT